MSKQRTAAPAECTCTDTELVAADLADTLDCPVAWEEVPGQGLRHVSPARVRAGAAKVRPAGWDGTVWQDASGQMRVAS